MTPNPAVAPVPFGHLYVEVVKNLSREIPYDPH